MRGMRISAPRAGRCFLGVLIGFQRFFGLPRRLQADCQLVLGTASHIGQPLGGLGFHGLQGGEDFPVALHRLIRLAGALVRFSLIQKFLEIARGSGLEEQEPGDHQHLSLPMRARAAYVYCTLSEEETMRAACFLFLLCAVPDDLTPLFNGKDLTGWEAVAGSGDCWEVRDSRIVCKGRQGGWLCTEEE